MISGALGGSIVMSVQCVNHNNNGFCAPWGGGKGQGRREGREGPEGEGRGGVDRWGSTT